MTSVNSNNYISHALSRGKMTNKELEKEKKNIIRDIVSQKKEKQRVAFY